MIGTFLSGQNFKNKNPNPSHLRAWETPIPWILCSFKPGPTIWHKFDTTGMYGIHTTLPFQVEPSPTFYRRHDYPCALLYLRQGYRQQVRELSCAPADGVLGGVRFKNWLLFLKRHSQALDTLQLKRYCCRRMVLTHVDLIVRLLEYSPIEKSDAVWFSIVSYSGFHFFLTVFSPDIRSISAII